MPNKKILFLLVFLIYAITRISTNLPALQNPRELADSAAYLRISREPLASQKFWGDARPFVFPLLLKISSQDAHAAALIQLAFSILAWSGLALALGASFQRAYLRLVSSGLILLLSLARPLASWDYVMMTESLSVTFFVLFLALGIWLAQQWKTYKAILLIFAAFLLAFTRDTNAYLLLLLAGMLILAALLRWLPPRWLILAASFAAIFLLNNYNADLGGRWVFPLNNNIGRRVLTNPRALAYFQNCGMPVSPALLALQGSFANGKERAFYQDPQLQNYRLWLRAEGKFCYMKYLLADPFAQIGDALKNFEALIRFDDLPKYFARRYDPLIPSFLEPWVYPAHFILLLWMMVSAGALFGLLKRLWRKNPLWGAYLPLALTLLPHLFIVWHGDAMAPERHALSVGLQLALSFWMMIFLLLDFQHE